MKILHVITDLDTGGAEMMLLKLLSRLDPEKFAPHVVSLLRPGPVAERIKKLGVGVSDLGLSRGLPTPGAFLRLSKIIKDFNPDIVQTWMYHADLIGFLAAKLARTGKVIWNIRCSNMELADYRPLTRWTLTINTRLSRFPACVVTNSYQAKEYHLGLGYRPRRFEVIPNGFDLDAFRPDESAGADLRRELNIPDNAPLIGLAARFDPMKGHDTFTEAAGLLLKTRPDVHFVLCGSGITKHNQALAEAARRAGLEKNAHLLGPRPDMPRIMAALNVATLSSSYGEGFPNVLGEAMACGTPCVVTDVGDSARIVGDTGLVAAPRDPQALARAWKRMLDMPEEERTALGRAARDRIRGHYSLETVTKRYAKLYEEIASGRKSS